MDPISDMLTSLRNAQASRLETITVKASKIKEAILAILKEEGYIEDYSLSEDIVKPELTVTLRYNNRQPAISHLKRISKPGLRVYRKRSEIRRPLQGLGLAIISTPAGILSDRSAKQKGLGGEILCEVW